MYGQKQLHHLFLALGTNLGNKEENLHNAIKFINERIGKVTAISAFYMTEPVGFKSENNFLNAACHVRTELGDPIHILELTQQIECEMGRNEKSSGKQYKDRIIDIDMLLFDDLVRVYPRLVIPHAHLHERDFVLLPLAEIASDCIHPVFNKTISQLKEQFLSIK